MRPLLVGVLSCALALPLHAQGGSGDGYLFHEPSVRLSGRAGFSHANASSDLFTDLTNQFILSKGDFSSAALGGEIGYQVSPRVELSVSADYAGRRKSSEYRHFEDNNGLPIQQTTRFERAPFMVNARISLVPRGRQVGRLAWIPSRIVPWIGGGVGAVWYRLSQVGDFINTQTNVVSPDELSSSGAAFGANAMGGFDIGLSPHVAVTADIRSTWARASLDPSSYSGYDKLDLSGVSATLGFTFRL
jgi:hypothetical protein